MALILSKNLRASRAATSESGTENSFDLKFTPGKTYDLDLIKSLNSRVSVDTSLLVEVKHYNQVAEEVSKVMLRENEIYSSELPSETVAEINKKLKNTLSEIMQKYGIRRVNEIPLNAYSELNKEMNDYLRAVFSDANNQFSVKFSDDGTVVTINYDFVSDDILNDEYKKYFKLYAKEFESKLIVEEGQLAIADSQKKPTTTTLDYKKYLLGEKSTKGYVPSNTGRRPILIWENGTDDTTSAEDEAEKEIHRGD